ncbi:FliM/FliN family flagellar motor switch protein [Pseudoalteromonas sp. SMS1]|uniref:FliM/FliN family flagellar motor switch protein n=1 Tax=Pseudoalteromonas sp. SMS1 TaxID=2908894 RepID=UPI001F1B5898|nr:FliM/FliN family flagellar motor switch protein [Pseudoalteromonas sp. SMS1]MCF2860230.1 FliM/FliN family flagellar motor switch protein [Pseudoalteromonas sp. SMS1]
MGFSYSAVLGLSSRNKVETHLVETLNAWSSKWLNKSLAQCEATFNETLFGSLALEAPVFESAHVAAKGEALCASLFCTATAYKGSLNNDDDALADEFSTHILNDLAAMLTTLGESDKSANRQWGVALDIQIGQSEFTLFVSAAAVENILKPVPHTFEQTLTSSISHLTVDTDILLSKTQINLAQLMSMQQGDVLPLSPSVKDAVNLKVNGTLLPKVGYLVSKHKHKSVIFLGE